MRGGYAAAAEPPLRAGITDAVIRPGALNGFTASRRYACVPVSPLDEPAAARGQMVPGTATGTGTGPGGERAPEATGVDVRHAGYARRWGKRTSTWDHHVSSAPGFAAVREALLRVAGCRREDDVIDLGAGTGFVTLAVAPKVSSVLAVDFAPPMLEALAEQAERVGATNVSTLQADLAVLDRPAGSLDLVVSSYALHHLEDVDKRRLVERTYAWLRPGGRIVVADMMFGRGLSQRDRQILRSKIAVLARKGPGGLWRIAKNAVRFGLRRGGELPATPEFWQDALVAAGFTEVRFEPVVAEAGVVSGLKPPAR